MAENSEETFERLEALPSESHYAVFCRTYLDKMKEYEQVWRFEELPLLKREELGLTEAIGEGVALESDGKYSLWISCRLPESKLGYLDKKDLKDILKKFLSFRKQNEKVNQLIILTTAIEVDSKLYDYDCFRIFTFDDQESEAEEILSTLEKSYAGKFKLYDYQREDLNKIIEKIKPEGSRQLFEAYCGYGKTNIFIELALDFHRKNSEELIIMAFPLLNIQNQTLARFYNHIQGLKDYDPAMICFSSSSNMGINKTTDYHTLSNFMREEAPKVIFTTYKSFNRLIRYLKEYKMPLIILDEVHNFNSWSILNNLRETNFVGFTATPLKATRDHFESVVNRDLLWSIENKRSCDFEFVTYKIINSKDGIIDGQAVVDLFKNRLVTKLLVISNRHKNLIAMKKIIDEYDIPCHLVSAADSQDERRKKEIEIEQADQGIILSMKIYREGIDFPWMDGLMFTSENIQSYQIVQSALRVTRTSPLKKNARIFFPVISNETRKIYHTEMFKLIPKFTSFLNSSSENKEEKNTLYYSRIRSITVDQTNDTFTIVKKEEIAECQSLFLEYCEFYKKEEAGHRLYGITWVRIVALAILALFDEDSFDIEDLLYDANVFASYKKAKGNYPERAMKKALIELAERHQIGSIDPHENVFHFNRTDLVEIAGMTPYDFPVEC